MNNRLSEDKFQAIQNLDSSIAHLSKKLSTVFGMKNDREIEFTKSLRLLFRACWGDRAALSQL